MATTNKGKTKAAAGPADRGLRVVPRVDGFRRAGRAWSGRTVVPLSELDAEQVEALKAETMLIVDEVDIVPEQASA